MNTFKLLERKSMKLENALEDMQECFKALLKEREDAIIEACRIVDLFNSTVLNIANVKFKNPINVKWMSEDMEIYNDKITEIYHFGTFEYGTITIDGTDDIPIECLTLDSLRLIRKEMKFGLWDVCLLDSDEDFHLVSYEELVKISREEHDKLYAYHTQDL